MPIRKLVMDEDFSDHMYALGDVDSERVTGRWGILDSQVAATAVENLPRLVQIAHGVRGDRDADRWFWGPFKDADSTFKVVDAARLHATLAAFWLRARIRRGGQSLDAHLVKLAALQGLETPLEGLHDLASHSLLRRPTSPPTAAGALKVWDGPDAEQDTDQRLNTLATGTEAVVSELATRIEQLGIWARDAELRFDREHRVIEWLLAGQRADGQQWEDLDAGAVILDAANELAAIVGGPPQPQHENILGQILKLAEVSVDGSGIDLAPATTPTAVVTYVGLADLVPLSVTRNSVNAPSFDIARRAMWERAALDLWASST